MKRNTARRVAVAGLAGLMTLTMAACGGDDSSSEGNSGASNEGGVTTLELWTHNGGNPAELAVYENRLRLQRRRTSTRSVRVVPAGRPTTTRSPPRPRPSKLPCLLDLDGPIMPELGLGGVPAAARAADELTDQLLPTAVGTWDDEIYSSGIRCRAGDLRARKSVLEANGIRIPTVEEPWTKDEFDAALAKLKAAGIRDAARHRRRGHRRVVAVRLLAVPAELRRRPHRPRRPC